MRNIAQYPITADEAVNALKWAGVEYSKNIQNYGIGGTEGIAFAMAEQFISSHRELFDAFTQAEMNRIFPKND